MIGYCLGEGNIKPFIQYLFFGVVNFLNLHILDSFLIHDLKLNNHNNRLTPRVKRIQQLLASSLRIPLNQSNLMLTSLHKIIFYQLLQHKKQYNLNLT